MFSESKLQALQGLHHRVARRLMAHGLHVTADPHGGPLGVPLIEGALEEAGLFPIKEYILQRQWGLAAYVHNRPIYQLCMESTRKSGTPTRWRRWWDQNLEEVV